MSELPELIGKTIERIYLNDENDIVLFECSDSIIAYYTEGDCCSYSWIEHLSVSEFPFTVSFCQGHGFGEDKQDIRDNHEVVEVYQTVLIDCDKKRSIIIEYRNDSIGHYEGWLRHITGELIFNKEPSILVITTEADPPLSARPDTTPVIVRKLIQMKDVSKGYNCG